MPDLDLATNTSILVVGVATAICCSLLSTYIVLRRMSLIAEGVAHAGFGGFGVAVLVGAALGFGNDSIWSKLITGAFCFGTAVAIRFVTRSRKVHDDSAIGIFLVTTMAIGMVLLKIAARAFDMRNLNAETLLFGDFMAATWMNAIVVSVTALMCIAVIGLLFYQFLYTTLDEEMARVNGVPTGLVNMLLLVLISLVVVVGSRMVGALMITALMIIPGATGSMLSRKFGGVMLASLITGTGGTLLALTLSFYTKLNVFLPGSILVLTLFLIFACVWLFRHLYKPKISELDMESPSDSHAGHSH